MVKRSDRGKNLPSAEAKAAKKSARKGDFENGVQKRGKLMLNNPAIPPELDEDIDDDLAFNSDDERMYGDFFAPKPSTDAKKSASKKGKKKSSPAERDQEDDPDYGDDYDDDDGDGDGMIDLSDMLDQSLAEEAAKKKKKGKAAKKTQLMTESGETVSKKRRSAAATLEPESLYGTANTGGDGSAGSYGEAVRKIVAKKGSSSKEEAAAKQRLKQTMENSHNLLALDADDKTKDRLTRKEVRSAVAESLDRYNPLLKQLDSAKHIHLPMALPDSKPVAASLGGIVSAVDARFRGDAGETSTHLKNSAAFRLGSKMDALLSQAGLSRRHVAEGADTPNSIGNYVRFDDGEGTSFGASGRRDGEGGGEEVPTTSYMAKLKAMLAYENSRRKRFNRIKSKTYRRILRKEKEHERERQRKAFELLHPELARKKLEERLLKARAEERVTQKHKNTSAWVKHAKRFAEFDGNTKDAINEQLATHQKLMQKMDEEAGENHYGRYMAGDGESEASSEEDRMVDELVAKVEAGKSGAAPTSKELVTSVLWSAVDDTPQAGAGSSASPMDRARAELREMKFMKNAREREEKEYTSQMDDLRRDIELYQRQEEAEDEGEAAEKLEASRSTAKNGSTPARMKFDGAKTSGLHPRVEQITLKGKKGIRAAVDADSADDLEDGFEAFGEGEDFPSEEDEGEVSDDDAPRARPTAKRLSKKEKTSSLTPKVSGGTDTDTFAGDRVGAKTQVMKKATPGSTHTTTRVTIKPTKRPRSDGDESGVSASELPIEDATADAEEDLKLHQEYLISRAFAHDDVDEDFVNEKQRQVDTLMKQPDKNESLPGWGEWGGEDEKLNQKHQENVAHRAMQRQIEKTFLMKSRADASLDHVIINHDGVELVPDRMTLHMVPRPFSNPQEFARSMRQPLGPEWTSALSFKEGVVPRVEVTQGHSVMPLDLSLRKKRNETKRRKVDTKR